MTSTRKQLPKGSESMDLRGESISAMLLTQYNSQLNSKYLFIYSQISGDFTFHQTNVFAISGDHYRNHNWPECREQLGVQCLAPIGRHIYNTAPVPN